MKNLNNFNFPHINLRSYLVIVILSVLCSLDVNAQVDEWNTGRKWPLIYTEAYMGYSTDEFNGIGQNLIWPNQWGIHVGYRKGLQTCKDKPASFKDGPSNSFNEISLRISKTFSVNKIIRFKAEWGIVQLNYETIHVKPYTVTGWVYHTSVGWWGGGSTTTRTWSTSTGYNISRTQDNSLGLSTRLVTEFAFSRVFELHVAIRGTVTKQHTFFGIETGFAIGRVREKCY